MAKANKTGITAVVMGGWGAEAEVSRNTGVACMAAAEAAGWECVAVEYDRNIAATLADLKPSRVFNALHGQYGEDGNIQGLLNIMDIPYTHSGVMASAIAMDKPVCNNILAQHGIAFPPSLPLTIKDERVHTTPPPFVIKPCNDGSSVGVVIVHPDNNEGERLAKTGVPLSHWAEGTQLMAEAYIPGRELTVGVLDGKPLTTTEIRQTRPFYDYAAKYEVGGSSHQLPAEIDKDIFDLALDWATRAHSSLGCRGVSRSDFRYDEANHKLYMLEINTQPGMTETSLVPEQAQHLGMDMPKLVTTLLEAAQCD
ncbi:MAG: D-alanine--D-alanine ligase [Proteobacteria bacterium]|nr:D-alanine--D-alanine ligase [Pseudomonadota bacterium]